MSRIYAIEASNITVVNAAVTLAFVNPEAGTVLEIIEAWAEQSANAVSAMQRIQLNYQVTAFPTLTSMTPRKTNSGDAASGIIGGTAGAAGTAGINASVEGGGAKTIIIERAFNVLNGFFWKPRFGEEIIVRAKDAMGFGLHLPVAPATLTGWTFGFLIREV